MKTAVIIPAYNEEPMIATVVSGVKALGYDAIVIDDGSSDQTARKAKQQGAMVLEHAINCGQGAAIQTGLDFAYELGYDIMVTFDADGQFDPSEIVEVKRPIEEGRASFVKGSRFLGKKANMEWYRYWCLQAAITFTNVTTGLTFTDVHNGFMAYSRKAVEEIRISTQPRMAHQSEIASELASSQLDFVEVPVTVYYTDYSKAKGQTFFSYVKILRDMFFSQFK